jgi:hypothetical protein
MNLKEMLRTGFIWLRIGTGGGGGSLENMIISLRFAQIVGNF